MIRFRAHSTSAQCLDVVFVGFACFRVVPNLLDLVKRKGELLFYIFLMRLELASKYLPLGLVAEQE
eukprot:509856-Amorphochlora_amoeboformis.AAC.1